VSRAIAETGLVDAPAVPLRASGGATAYVELAKPGITRMVSMASGVGFALAAILHGLPLAEWIVPGLGCLFGTALASAGANAINQILEISRDACMPRTAGRPLPSGRLSAREAAVFAVVCSVLGPGILVLTATGWAAAAAMATILLYSFVYTPLKVRTSLAVLIGALPGAMPVAVGWLGAAPNGPADLAGGPFWSVFGLLAAWQIPHFLAIACVYRAEYAAGGFRLIPGAASDRTISLVILAWTVTVAAVALTPLLTMPERVGTLYLIGSSLAGFVFIATAVRMLLAAGPTTARRVFLASVLYLPVVMGALVADVAIHAVAQ
jgi:protoheme IX farnesyltransferase